MRSITIWIGIFIAVLFCSSCEPLNFPFGKRTSANQQPSLILPNPKAITNPGGPVSTRSFFQGPLSVVITKPDDNAVLSTSPVMIEGEANPGTVISLNDALVIVDASHKFNVPIPLQNGLNTIEIVASDEQGNQEYGFLTLSLEESETQ
jgi:hypothetical protein